MIVETSAHPPQRCNRSYVVAHVFFFFFFFFYAAPPLKMPMLLSARAPLAR